MVETISDKNFMKKWFGDNYALSEGDLNSGNEWKKSGGAYKDMWKRNDTEYTTVPDVTNPLVEIDQMNLMHYYGVSEAISDWDGACSLNNNYYMAYNGDKWHVIPGGPDRTFGCGAEGTLITRPKMNNNKCIQMEECFSNSTCNEIYQKGVRGATEEAARAVRIPVCPDMTHTLLLHVLLPPGIVIAMLTLLGFMRPFC